MTEMTNITVRVSRDMRDRVERAALHDGMGIASFTRNAIFKTVREREREMIEQNAILEQVAQTQE